MKENSKIIVMILALVIFLGFFLPWINVESAAVGSFSKMITGKKQAVLDSISALRVPIMANSNDSRFMIDVIKIFNPNVKDADKKSYLIWAIPLLALAMAVFYYVWGGNKWLNLAYGIAGCAIFFAAVYKIKTTNLDKLVLQVTTAPGLWLTLWGYLGIGIFGFTTFAGKALKKK
jgi:hypothetical protein